MWILPSNHPLSSAFAPDFLVSKEDWKEQSEKSKLPLMWKSKPLSVQTWLQGWKRVYWRQHLSGRMLKHSTHIHFVEKYTATLVVIPVSHSPMPEIKKEQMIQDTFGRIYQNTLKQLNLFGASLKTSVDTSPWDLMKFTEAFQLWVMQLSAESLQRRKLVRHINGNGYLSSPSGKNIWATPTVMATRKEMNLMQLELVRQKIKDKTGNGNGFGLNLHQQVRNWPTPNTMDMMPPRSYDAAMKQATTTRKGRTNPANLREIVDEEVTQAYKDANWPTPTANEDSYRLTGNSQQSNSLSAIMRREALSNGQQNPDKINTNGKSREQLNPAWVAQINGYNFREDLLRAYGNSVVEQTAELAFIELFKKQFQLK